MSIIDQARTASASAAGQVLAGATRSLALVRPAAKPLHPRGELMRGRLYRHGLGPATDVDWLDQPGEDDVLVRLSRAIGLPGALPDIHGLAVRIPVEGGGVGDLLFASTGWGKLSRYVLTAARSPQTRPMTTLLPYRAPVGAVLLGARANGVESFELSCATHDSDFRVFADLRVSRSAVDDQDVAFDPVLNQLPGLDQYPAVELLREPAYRRARDSRSA
jgi:hypothetical protein